MNKNKNSTRLWNGMAWILQHVPLSPDFPTFRFSHSPFGFFIFKILRKAHSAFSFFAFVWWGMFVKKISCFILHHFIFGFIFVFVLAFIFENRLDILFFIQTSFGYILFFILKFTYSDIIVYILEYGEWVYIRLFYLFIFILI